MLSTASNSPIKDTSGTHESNADMAQLIATLREAFAEGEVLTDDNTCRLYAQDVFTCDLPAILVLRPGNVDELQAAQRALHQYNVPCIPHGGGMSYTGGLVPESSGWAVIDLGRMNRVLDINEEDMTVTVECGCSWKALHEALKDTGLRTPYWGTLSGSRATVGGGLSQNSIFWGSGQHGTAADSALSLAVVTADGSLLETGSAAQKQATPFFRHFGPDLTGVFCADTGALGIKARATLRLIPELPAREYLAFDFSTAEGTIAAMSDIARAGLASECFGFDPFLQRLRLKRQGMASDIKALAGVVKNSGSILDGVKAGAKVAMAGRRYMDDVDFSVQIIVEDRTVAAAEDRAESVRTLVEKHGGREIENSIPKITRANPFGPVNSMLGPEGERWLPIHGLFPHSKFQQAYAATEALFEEHRERNDQLGIGTGYLFATISTNACVLEPVFFWPDEWFDIHKDAVEADHLARLNESAKNPEAREQVNLLRRTLIDLYSELGGVHMQIGRSYHYRDALKEEPGQLIDAIKAAVDQQNLMNPGSLGLRSKS
ncbi:MAG: FAD-binding oxidoreductase [Pseudomonadota bacterium]